MIYTHGIAFDDLGRVALISNAKQDNKWAGIGGKVENGESTKDTMVREFYEEAGVFVGHEHWKQFGKILTPENDIYLFTIEHRAIRDVTTQSEGKIKLFTQRDLHVLKGAGELYWRNTYVTIQSARIALTDYSFNLTLQYSSMEHLA